MGIVTEEQFHSFTSMTAEHPVAAFDSNWPSEDQEHKSLLEKTSLRLKQVKCCHIWDKPPERGEPRVRF